MATKIPLDERIELAAELIKRARIFYDIWWFYEEEDTRSKNLYTMNRYSAFFRFDSYAHLASLIVHLAGLFECRGNTINFNALIKEAIASGLFATEAIDRVREKITEVQDISSKLVILRNNLFAHRSASLSYKDAFSKADLIANQLRDITATGLQIANLLLLARGLPEQFFYEPPRRHIEALLCDLAKSEGRR